MGIICIIGFIFVWIIPMIKEANENEEYRQWCVRNGVDKYTHVDGTYRYTKTNEKVYK